MIPILTSKTPKLDLHGEIREMVYPLITEFINYHLLLNSKIIRIIHGKSTNLLKNEVHLILKNNKNVSKYYLNNWNLGETIVILKSQ